MLTTNPGSEEQWANQIDAVVSHVFQTMLLRSCGVAGQDAAQDHDISARVVFTGAVAGHCVVEFPFTTAEKLTDAYLGTEDGEWDDAMIEDAVGELCNMIAGGWKGKLGKLDSACQLSAPSIWRSTSWRRTGRAPNMTGTRVRRTYTFDGSAFNVRLVLG